MEGLGGKTHVYRMFSLPISGITFLTFFFCLFFFLLSGSRLRAAGGSNGVYPTGKGDPTYLRI